MEYLYKFIHNEWTDICILNPKKFKIRRKNIIDEEGEYKIEDNKIIINWYNWKDTNIFIKINNSYYHEQFYKEKVFYFIHYDWSDICLIDNNFIKKENNDDYGTFIIENNKIIINWNKCNTNENFIKFNNNYYEEIFYINNIENSNIIELSLEYNISSIECLLNIDKSLIYKKNKILENGIFKMDNNNLIIDWNNNFNEEFIKIDNKYFEKSFILDSNKKDNIRYKVEKFKKINNEFYLNKYFNSFLEIDEIITSYNILEYSPKNHIINDGLQNLLNNNLLNNKNYLNIQNINLYLNSFKYEDFFYNLTNLDLNFKIPIKEKKRCLTLVEWGYPPFGGGEEWLLNFNKILFNNGYDNYLICFSDPFKNEYFDKIKLIDLNYIKIIQMPKDIISIIKIIKIINPDIINHQGIYREYFMKISNILEIPFLTGFCFWQNIIKFNQDNINVNMLSNNSLEKTDEFESILKNSYTYVSSDFVNDIIYKLYNKKLDIIETISLKEDFYIDNFDYNTKKFITLINCHHNKGGYLLKYLFENLDINIPILIVNTENDPIITIEYLNNLLNERNKKNNINKLIIEKIDIRIIYRRTRLLLIPSICEETFCKIGYEGMINKIPILSTRNGNLKYLLKDYSIFMDDDNKEEWKNQIENIYYNINFLKKYENLEINQNMEEIIEKKIIDKIENIKTSKYKLNENNIGLIIPWADQGLGIQGREYYISLKEIGYVPYVLSFRPYHATYENIYLQSNKQEWDYENITYTSNIRENISYDEILDFVYKNNIKKIIIIEASYINIFKIAFFLKLINIKIYLVVNIECIRMVELNFHNIFDKILTNNLESTLIISNIFKNKCLHLGFNLNHYYFNEINKNIKLNINKIKFCCVGGLNSITRKNIHFIISSFYNIYLDNIHKNWELNVYIQGVEIPPMLDKYKCENIIYHIDNFNYQSIVNVYNKNDIFIHMGSHEGLGLGFFESLYCGTPILTMNWTPNNEIIQNYVNGWLINCTYSEIYDNDNSMINKGVINEIDLKDKINEILIDQKTTLKIINNTINNKIDLQTENKFKFNKNLIEILSS